MMLMAEKRQGEDERCGGGGGDLSKATASYECCYENCTSTFARPYRLEAHLKIHLGYKKFECAEGNCNKAYTNKAHLIRHILTNHTDCHYKHIHLCPICNASFANRQNVKRHVSRAHSDRKTFPCSYCTQRFHKHSLLASHEYTHTGIMPFRCEFCSCEFVNLSQLNKHKKRHRSHQCPHCRQLFQLWSKFSKHRKECPSGKAYTCDICSKRFKSKVYLKSHIFIHTNPDQRIRFPCTEFSCPKVYSKKNNLIHHINSVHKKITFDCDRCNAKLATKQKLEVHSRKHEEGHRPRERRKESGKRRRSRKDKGSCKNITLSKLCSLSQSLVRKIP